MRDLPWEDNLLERKLESDLKDLRKTLVAFANSVAPGHVATILVGEGDDGTAQGLRNPDQTQKTVRKECEQIYPSILWRSSVYEKDGRHCVRVEIEYSGDTPHFGDAAWIRRGSESVRASEEMFLKLIELRLSKVRELSKWVGQRVTVDGDNTGVADLRVAGQWIRWRNPTPLYLVSVNAHWVTFGGDRGERTSEPLEKLSLSFDHDHDCLLVLVKP